MISRLGNCPKCSGFLMLEKDVHGWYHQCLQCGYMRDLHDGDQLGARTSGHETGDEAFIHTSLDSSSETAQSIEIEGPQYETISEIVEQAANTAVH